MSISDEAVGAAMSNTAPALTDEQVTRARNRIREVYVVCSPNRDAAEDRFDAWLTAVEARAKREERERIGALDAGGEG